MQLEKIYDPANEEDDMVEMEEERLRMREHVMNEVNFYIFQCSRICELGHAYHHPRIFTVIGPEL